MARVFKKRAKVFHGIQYQHLPAGPSSSSVEAELVRPIPMETASSIKLAISPPSSSSRSTLLRSTSSAGESESYDNVGEKAGYRLISCERLDQAPSSHKCSVCLSPCTLEEDLATRRGLVSKLSVAPMLRVARKLCCLTLTLRRQNL